MVASDKFVHRDKNNSSLDLLILSLDRKAFSAGRLRAQLDGLCPYRVRGEFKYLLNLEFPRSRRIFPLLIETRNRRWFYQIEAQIVPLHHCDSLKGNGF